MAGYVCIRWRIFLESMEAGYAINLRFNLRLVCPAVPFNWDQQFWLINLLAEKMFELDEQYKASFAVSQYSWQHVGT